MDDRRGTPGGPFLRNRKSALAAVIEKYSKEDPEEDDIVDIFGECLYVDRGSLLKKTSEREFSQVLADFVLNSDIEWSSSSSTLASSPSCCSGPKALSQLFVPLTDVGKKLSALAADVQPSERESDPFPGCDNDVADGNSDCSRGSSRRCRNCRCHSSSHEKKQQQQQHRQQQQPQQQPQQQLQQQLQQQPQQHQQEQHQQQQQEQIQQHETRQQHQQHETRQHQQQHETRQQQQQQHETRQRKHQQHETRQQQQHQQHETRQQQQHETRQQQHQQYETRQQQFRVGVQSNPYFLLSPSKEQCSAGRSSRSHRGASSSATAATDARVVVDKRPAVEHEGVSSSCSSSRNCRRVVPTNAWFSSSDRRTVSGCAELYSIDCFPRAAPRCVSIADGRSSAAQASHSAARRRHIDCRPQHAERGSTQAVPDSTGTSLGNFADESSLRSSLPSATEARRPQLLPVSLQEKAGRRSHRQPAKWSAVSATIVAADQPTPATDQPTLAVEQPRLAASAVSALAELGAPGEPITSRSLSSLGKFLPGEWIATYLTRFAEVADCQSPLILPPADPSPSLSPAAATHHLTDRRPVIGSAVAETLAAVSIPCNDAFFVAAGADSAEHQPSSSMPAGPTAADSASGAMHARHFRARHIDREVVVPSSSCRAGGLQARRAVEAEPSGAVHCEVLTPSCSRSSSPTAFGSVQLCRSALPAVPAAPAAADDGRGSLAAPHHAHSRHQPSHVPHGGSDVVRNSVDDDSTVEQHWAVVSASSNEVTWATRATSKRDHGCTGDQTRLSTLHLLCDPSASNPGGLHRAGSAVRSVATHHFSVKHDRRLRDSSDDGYSHKDLGETPADEQSELNQALVAAPDSVEATSWLGRDASPYVGDCRSSLDVAGTPLLPTAFLCVEPPPGWRAGDSTPSDEAVRSVLYTPPTDFRLHTHSTSNLYTPPSEFGAVRAADVQPPLRPPVAVADSGRRMSHDATPSAKPMPEGRFCEPNGFEQWHPCDPFAPLTAVERKLSGMVRSWNMARKSMACSNGTPTHALLYSRTQPNAGQLGRCSSCGGSTPAEAAHAAAAAHLFGSAARCSHACSSDKA